MKFRLLCLIVLFSPLVRAEEINVADHGIVPGKDATYPLYKLLGSVKGESDVTLVFPKGQYESGAVGDVTIRNNVFENVGFAGDEAYPLLASPLLDSATFHTKFCVSPSQLAAGR